MIDQVQTVDGAPPAEADAERRAVRRRLMYRIGPYLGVSVVLIVLITYLSFTEPTFRTYSNAMNILSTSSVSLIVGVGLTLVLLGGGFDISVGGMLSLAGVVLAIMVNDWNIPTVVAIVLVVLAGAGIGAGTNGMLIAKGGLQFFVVTIGTMSIFGGLALVITGGESQALYNNHLIVTLGNGTVGSIPYIVIVAAGVVAIFFVVTRYIGYGRMLYAVGGNEDAARLAGISVVGVRVTAYGICAGLAALAGVVQAARLGSAEPTAGADIALTASAAVLLGGTSFEGGIGGVIGTVLGTVFFGVVANGLTIAGVSSFYQGIITGTVLIAAIAADSVRRRRL